MEPKGIVVARPPKVIAFTYREEGARDIPGFYPNDEEYGRALQRFIVVCADVVIVNTGRREIFLARRRSKPLTGWWWLGGGQKVNETKVEAAIRNFKRETGIVLSPAQLVYRADQDYFWKDRQQEPQTYGCHMAGHTFTVDLTDEEIAGIHLNPDEFEAEKGLTPFTREKLVEEGVFVAVLDLYDQVFPRQGSANLFHTVLISFHKDVPEETRRDVYRRYQTLDKDCGGREAGILYWKVEYNLDLRKNVHLVKIAIFENGDAFQKFRAHPRRAEIATTLSKIADWQVGDIPLAPIPGF